LQQQPLDGYVLWFGKAVEKCGSLLQQVTEQVLNCLEQFVLSELCSLFTLNLQNPGTY
jgi:hypothetical protein